MLYSCIVTQKNYGDFNVNFSSSPIDRSSLLTIFFNDTLFARATINAVFLRYIDQIATKTFTLYFSFHNQS